MFYFLPNDISLSICVEDTLNNKFAGYAVHLLNGVCLGWFDTSRITEIEKRKKRMILHEEQEDRVLKFLHLPKKSRVVIRDVPKSFS